MADKIRVLWLCNFMPSFVGERLGLDTTNKEGWIAGMAAEVLTNDDIELAVAYPISETELIKGVVDNIRYYGFPEDATHPEIYDENLEKSMESICDDFSPEVIHCFGTEYPHTLALLNNEKYAGKAALHLQGLMEPYASAYYTGLPMRVIKRRTFRDVLRSDSIIDQKKKYFERAGFEKRALSKAKNVLGRTEFDHEYAKKVCPQAKYYELCETLRDCFYGECWEREKTRPHSIFVSQGNYPLKGLHFALEALAIIKKDYPDVMMTVTGDNITRHGSLIEKIKLSSYGKFLLELVNRYGLEDNVVFAGQKDAEQMLQLFKESSVFLIPSVLENSPNSLGEAMLLGMPCVASRVGGIPSMASEKEAMLYRVDDIEALSIAIKTLFEDTEMAIRLGKAAKERAELTHSKSGNYKKMLEIYRDIATK